MAKKRKPTAAEKKAKEVDVSDIDDKSVSDFATKPVEDVLDKDLGNDSEIENPDAVKEADESEDKKPSIIERIRARFNLYLILFGFVVIVAVVLIIVVNNANSFSDDDKITFEGTELNQDALNDLLSRETNVGTVDQTLTVEANAIFNGKILVKDSLDVAGSINVGGPLSLPGITVAGDSNFENISVDNNLSILGSATIEENLNIQSSLTVGGGASIGGTLSAANITAENFSFSGDFEVTRHIDTNGGTPRVNRGTALGGGGTVTISGNDVSGTVTVNTGSSPPAGIFARIDFVLGYNETPRVQITPVGSTSGSLNYYVDRNASNFSIGTTGAPSAGTTYSFDYFVTE